MYLKSDLEGIRERMGIPIVCVCINLGMEKISDKHGTWGTTEPTEKEEHGGLGKRQYLSFSLTKLTGVPVA